MICKVTDNPHCSVVLWSLSPFWQVVWTVWQVAKPLTNCFAVPRTSQKFPCTSLRVTWTAWLFTWIFLPVPWTNRKAHWSFCKLPELHHNLFSLPDKFVAVSLSFNFLLSVLNLITSSLNLTATFLKFQASSLNSLVSSLDILVNFPDLFNNSRKIPSKLLELARKFS